MDTACLRDVCSCQLQLPSLCPSQPLRTRQPCVFRPLLTSTFQCDFFFLSLVIVPWFIQIPSHNFNLDARGMNEASIIYNVFSTYIYHNLTISCQKAWSCFSVFYYFKQCDRDCVYIPLYSYSNISVVKILDRGIADQRIYAFKT